MQSKIKIRSRYVPEGMKILYDDDDIVVIDKSTSLLTVNAIEDQDQTAQKLVTEYIRKGNSRSNLKAHVIYRLDKNTSGVLVFAKSEKHAETMRAALPAAKQVYWAVVVGRLKEKTGKVKSYLAESETHEVTIVSDPKKGLEAITEYTVLKEAQYNSLVELRLLTNVKDQMRVQMASLGCPILGDVRHGAEGNKTRVVLHLRSLTFAHPFTGAECTFEAKPSLAFEKHLYGGPIRKAARPLGPRETAPGTRPNAPKEPGTFVHPKSRHTEPRK